MSIGAVESTGRGGGADVGGFALASKEYILSKDRSKSVSEKMPRPRAGELHDHSYQDVAPLSDAPALRRGASRYRLGAASVSLPGARPGHPRAERLLVANDVSLPGARPGHQAFLLRNALRSLENRVPPRNQGTNGSWGKYGPV
jgi:hypothetical protein